MDSDYRLVILAAMVVVLVGMIAVHIPHMFKGRGLLNMTADWTPAPEPQPGTPSMTSLVPYDLRLISSHLEAGEKPEGFGRGFFLPYRARDWRFAVGVEKLNVLIAVTSRRILLFEVTLRTVHRYRFIPYDQIAYLQPPKPGFLGSSGRVRFGLRSGHEYQMSLFSPLLNEEAMRQERNMAAYLRQIAPRFPLSPRSSTPQAAA